MKRISPALYYLLGLTLLCAAGWFFEDHDSGFRVGTYIFGGLLVAFPIYNKLHNKTWFTDSAAGN